MRNDRNHLTNLTQMDYKLTQEYRDRHALNGGDLYWIKEAFASHGEAMRSEIQTMVDEGKRPIMTPEFPALMLQDILSKLEMWAEVSE